MPLLNEARWWEVLDKERIICTLCPRHCLLAEGKHGFCYIRKNENGQLVNLGYGHPIALHVDPIEKKPLNHFLPGTDILSLGTAGCNMGCRFCQNWDLSTARETQEHTREVSAEQVVELARRQGVPSIAFTYNEPTIWGEYVIDIAEQAQAHGLRTVMVTNGYVDPKPLRDIYAHIDAANVDLKGFTQEFYGRMTLSNLQPVLETLVHLRHEMGTWIEITNLMIPGKNDAPTETSQLCEWIVNELGVDTPLHFTAFHPDYQSREIPRTPGETLSNARRIAMAAGLRYVYIGNVHDEDGQTTFCWQCGMPLIRRNWHSVMENRLQDGHCPKCQASIAGVF